MLLANPSSFFNIGYIYNFCFYQVCSSCNYYCCLLGPYIQPCLLFPHLFLVLPISANDHTCQHHNKGQNMINKTHVNHQPIKPMQLVSYSLATWLSFLVPQIVNVNLPNILFLFHYMELQVN